MTKFLFFISIDLKLIIFDSEDLYQSNFADIP